MTYMTIWRFLRSLNRSQALAQLPVACSTVKHRSLVVQLSTGASDGKLGEGLGTTVGNTTSSLPHPDYCLETAADHPCHSHEGSCTYKDGAKSCHMQSLIKYYTGTLNWAVRMLTLNRSFFPLGAWWPLVKQQEENTVFVKRVAIATYQMTWSWMLTSSSVRYKQRQKCHHSWTNTHHQILEEMWFC